MAVPRIRTVPAGTDAGPGFERRRSRRRRLQTPTDVQLRGLGDESKWQCVGALLNVSHEGMACRINDRKASELCIRQSLQAVFRVGASTTPFDLTAMITNMTPAGTAGQQVIGLEFVDDARLRSARAALREAIARANEPANRETD